MFLDICDLVARTVGLREEALTWPESAVHACIQNDLAVTSAEGMTSFIHLLRVSCTLHLRGASRAAAALRSVPPLAALHPW